MARDWATPRAGDAGERGAARHWRVCRGKARPLRSGPPWRPSGPRRALAAQRRQGPGLRDVGPRVGSARSPARRGAEPKKRPRPRPRASGATVAGRGLPPRAAGASTGPVRGRGLGRGVGARVARGIGPAAAPGVDQRTNDLKKHWWNGSRSGSASRCATLSRTTLDGDLSCYNPYHPAP